MKQAHPSHAGNRKEPAGPAEHPNRALKIILRQKRFIFLLVVLLLLYVVSPQLTALNASLKTLAQASPLYIGLGLMMTVLTYVLSAETYHLLVKHPVPLNRLLLTQTATALTSRVAPIGVGTIGLNIIFLRRQKHTLAEAVAVAATNNGLGIVGHLIIIALLATTGPLPDNLRLHVGHTTIVIIGGCLVLLAACLVPFKKLRRRIVKAAAQTLHNVASYRHRPKVVLLALCVSMAVSICYVTALAACARAVGIPLPFSEVFLIYTLSLITGAATPTPGGLVGVEAGLVGGFVAYGIDPNTALATALLYRLVTYWLPLLPGLVALRALQHRYL